MMDVTYRRLSGSDASAEVASLVDPYFAAYAEDPDIGHSIYAREAFLTRTKRQAGSEGFRLVVARAGDRVVGFSFGLPFPAGRWWRGDSTSEPPAEILNVDKFSVIELVVIPEYQGQGLASRLMKFVLEGRQEPFAMLLADKEGHARSIYDRWGWRAVQRLRPASDVPSLDVLVLPLRSESAS
jgi:GNAT superfamily N-acetyltransferase